MNRIFLFIVVVYFLVVLPLVWLTDTNVNDLDDTELMRLALYTPILVSSYFMALFAMIAAYREHRKRRVPIIGWPPEWDFNVAGWAFTKALFFTVLWLIVAGWRVSEWVLIAALISFCWGHIFFTAQWLGPAGSRTAGRPRG